MGVEKKMPMLRGKLHRIPKERVVADKEGRSDGKEGKKKIGFSHLKRVLFLSKCKRLDATAHQRSMFLFAPWCFPLPLLFRNRQTYP